MCDSVHRGVCLSACWDTTPPPRKEAPPLEGSTRPEGSTTPGKEAQPLEGNTPPPWEGSTPTGRKHPPPGIPAYGQWAASTHPTGMHYCWNYNYVIFHLAKRIWFHDNGKLNVIFMIKTIYKEFLHAIISSCCHSTEQEYLGPCGLLTSWTKGAPTAIDMIPHCGWVLVYMGR